MFRWKKDKDKEKDDKKKKDKKEKNLRKPASEKEPLSQEELKRLDEVRRSFISHVSDKQEEDGIEKYSNSSDYSLSSAADSSPSGGSISQIDPNKSGSPNKRPPPIPKKPVLRVKPHQTQSNLQTMPSPQGSTYSMMSLHLGPNNLTNEMMEYMEQMNHESGISSVTQAANSLSPIKPSVPTAPPSQIPPGEQGGYGVRWKSYALDLRLPPITYMKPPMIRTLTISRQPTGDFGFSLRRAAIIERNSVQGDSKQTIIFAEPNNIGNVNLMGLMPGDRLLEVNETPVESLTREEIIKLIQSSGDSVILKVQPMPELRELSNRCGFDNVDGVVTKSGRSGTLSRSGSHRFKTVAKSEQQVENEKNWLQTGKVWVTHKGGFSSAQLMKSGPPPPEGKVRVKLEFTGDELEVDEEDVEKEL